MAHHKPISATVIYLMPFFLPLIGFKVLPNRFDFFLLILVSLTFSSKIGLKSTFLSSITYSKLFLIFSASLPLTALLVR